MAKITVIIPAYNAATTLTRTVQSVLAQTLRDIKVIIVDDGATDATPKLADDLAESDERVMVIHQSNTGCYGARLAGMKKVQTKYFGFVDADDYIAPTMYEKLYNFVEENNLDIAQCNWRGGDVSSKVFNTREVILKEIVMPRLIEGVDAMLVWDKLYRNQYDFGSWVDGYFGTYEDLIHNMQLFLPVSRVGYLNEKLYSYEVSALSATRNFPRNDVAAMRKVIQSHTDLAMRYDLPNGVVQDLASKWTITNAKNAIILVCSVKAPSWNVRLSYVRELIEMPELCDALSRCSISCGWFIRVFKFLPLAFSVFVVRMMKKAQMWVRR